MMDLENRVLTMVKTYFPETPENIQVQVGAFLTSECWNLRGVEPVELDTIFNQDCLMGLKALPNKSIDLILTDPPYGKKADKGTNGFGAAKNRRYAGGWDGMIPPP